MRLPKYLSRLAQLTGNNQLLTLISLMSVATNLLLMLWLWNVDTSEKTIITPPTLDQAFWIQGDNLDPEYLTQMADWFVGLALTYNPQNARSRSDLLLKYAHPAKHGALAVAAEQRIKDIERYRESSIFYIKEIRVKGMQVALIGDLRRNVGEREVERREMVYRVDFRYQHGRLSVWDLVEAPRNAPFDRVAATDSN